MSAPLPQDPGRSGADLAVTGGAIGPGARFAGRYELRRMLARGGMAEVWEGHDDILSRPVAVKVLPLHLAADRSFVERFHREAVIAARLGHANVVATYDTGVDHGTAYIVMELVRGRTLRDLLSSSGALEPTLAVGIAGQIADALAHAHRAGLVHRDIKPANVLLVDDDSGPPRVKVADFGIAKTTAAGEDLTRTGAVLGTPKYLSPEQVRGDQDPDARSDLYALGVVLFEMLTGRAPLVGATEMATALAHLNDVPPAPSRLVGGVPPELDALVADLLAKDPARRPPTAVAARQALEVVHRHLSAGRPRRPPPGRGDPTVTGPAGRAGRPTALSGPVGTVRWAAESGTGPARGRGDTPRPSSRPGSAVRPAPPGAAAAPVETAAHRAGPGSRRPAGRQPGDPTPAGTAFRPAGASGAGSDPTTGQRTGAGSPGGATAVSGDGRRRGHDEYDRPGRRRRRRGPGLVVLLLVVVAAGVGAVLVDHGRPGTTTRAGSAAPVYVPTGAAVWMDNPRPPDNPSEASHVLDGNPATVWSTEVYNPPRATFGNLYDGIGLVITLRRDETLRDLVVDSPTEDWSASTYVSTTPIASGGTVSSWGRATDTRRSIRGDATFSLGGRRGRYILLWLTNIGPTGQASIGEVTVR